MNPKRQMKQVLAIKQGRFFGKDITNIEHRDTSKKKQCKRSLSELEKSLIVNKARKNPKG